MQAVICPCTSWRYVAYFWPRVAVLVGLVVAVPVSTSRLTSRGRRQRD